MYVFFIFTYLLVLACTCLYLLVLACTYWVRVGERGFRFSSFLAFGVVVLNE